MFYSKLLILVIVLVNILNAEITINKRSDTIINSNTPTSLNYGYYFDKFQAQTIKLFDKLDLSNYKNKTLYVGYGVYDKQENYCKYLDVDYNKKNFKQYFTTIKVLNKKTYAISLKKYSLSDAKKLVSRFSGYIVAPNSITLNNTLNNIYKNRDYWIGLFRKNCDEDFKNNDGIIPQYINLAFSENICNKNKLAVYKKANSSLWFYDNPKHKHYVIIEINSPDYKRPIKICSPWWRIERTYNKEINNENPEVTKALTILKYQYPPKATRLCVEYEKASLSNERYTTTCKKYYDRQADPICATDLYNSICLVNTCKGYIENSCNLKQQFSPLKDYTYSYVTDDKTGQTKRIKDKDKIVEYVYDCPPIPPSANSCLKSQRILVYPAECPNSQCNKLVQCLKEGNSETVCKSKYKCEVQYGSVDSQDIDKNGNVIGLYGKCSDGSTVEAKVAALTQKEIKCLEYETIKEINTTLKTCETTAKESKHSVNANITEKDIYQTDPNCIRMNNIVDARPDEEINLLVTQPGNVKTLITYNYIDNYSTNTTDSNISNIYFSDNSNIVDKYINLGIKTVENTREIKTSLKKEPDLLSEKWFVNRIDLFSGDEESDSLNPNVLAEIKRKDNKNVKQCSNPNDILMSNDNCYLSKDDTYKVFDAKIYNKSDYSFITTLLDKNHIKNVCYDENDSDTQYIENEKLCMGSYLCSGEKCPNNAVVDGTCPYPDLTPFNAQTGMCESTSSAIVFNKWKSYGDGNWTLSDDGSYVFQNINGKKTAFVSDFLIKGKFTISGTMNVNKDSWDDNDFIGLVFNFKDMNNYYVVDWDRSSDKWHNYTGWRLIKVKNGKETLLKQTDSDGWQFETDYNVKVIVDEEKTRVFIDDLEVLTYKGDLTSSTGGKVGFYNYSQGKVAYSNFTLKTLPICEDGYNLAPNGQCVMGDLSCVSKNYTFNVLTQRCEANITKCPDGYAIDEKGFCKNSSNNKVDIKKGEYLFITKDKVDSDTITKYSLTEISDDKKQEYLINYPFDYLEDENVTLSNIDSYNLYLSDKLVAPDEFAVYENKGDYLLIKSKNLVLSNECKDYAKDLDDSNWTISDTDGCVIKYGEDKELEAVAPTNMAISTLDGDFIPIKTNGYNKIFAIQNYLENDKMNWFSTYTMPPIKGSEVIDNDTKEKIIPMSEYPYVFDNLTYKATITQKTIRTKVSPPKIPEYRYENSIWVNILSGSLNDGSYYNNNFIENIYQQATGAINLLESSFDIPPIILSSFIVKGALGATLEPMAYVINIFRKSAKFADYKIEWEVYKDGNSKYYTNKDLSPKREAIYNENEYLTKILYEKQKYESGLLKSGDINKKIAEYYNYKNFSLNLLGVDNDLIKSFKDSYEEKISIGFKKCKWWKSCHNKTKTSTHTVKKVFKKKVTTAWSNSVNNLTIYVPYLGDYTVEAYDKYNNLLARKTIYAKNFDNSSTHYAYQRVNLASADNFNIDYSIKDGNTTNACRYSTEVEWGGGVSGINYEISDPMGFKCDKSNDSYVKLHSATLIKIKPANFTHWFEIHLIKPMPYANRIIVITGGELENREYKCYQENNCTVQ